MTQAHPDELKHLLRDLGYEARKAGLVVSDAGDLFQRLREVEQELKAVARGRTPEEALNDADCAKLNRTRAELYVELGAKVLESFFPDELPAPLDDLARQARALQSDAAPVRVAPEWDAIEEQLPFARPERRRQRALLVLLGFGAAVAIAAALSLLLYWEFRSDEGTWLARTETDGSSRADAPVTGAPSGDVLEITAPDAVRALWESWSGQYVLFVHRDKPVSDFKDFAGRPFLCAFIDASTIVSDTQKLAMAGEIPTNISIQNNPDTYKSDLLEQPDAIGIMTPEVAQRCKISEDTALVQVVIQSASPVSGGAVPPPVPADLSPADEKRVSEVKDMLDKIAGLDPDKANLDEHQALIDTLKTNGAEYSAATPILTEALSHTNWMVRMVAAQALGKIGPGAQASTPQLSENLKDPNIAVRISAFLAFESIAPETEHVWKRILADGLVFDDGDVRSFTRAFQAVMAFDAITLDLFTSHRIGGADEEFSSFSVAQLVETYGPPDSTSVDSELPNTKVYQYGPVGVYVTEDAQKILTNTVSLYDVLWVMLARLKGDSSGVNVQTITGLPTLVLPSKTSESPIGIAPETGSNGVPAPSQPGETTTPAAPTAVSTKDEEREQGDPDVPPGPVFGQSFNTIEGVSGNSYMLDGYSSIVQNESGAFSPNAVLVVGIEDGVELGGRIFDYGCIVLVEGTATDPTFRLATPDDNIVLGSEVTVFGKKYAEGRFTVPAGGKIDLEGATPQSSEST